MDSLPELLVVVKEEEEEVGEIMSDIENLSVDELFRLLESNNKSVVEEIQRLIHEKFSGNTPSLIFKRYFSFLIIIFIQRRKFGVAYTSSSQG